MVGAVIGACWSLVIGHEVKNWFADGERREALRALLAKAREPAPKEGEQQGPSGPIDVLC